MLYLGSGRRVFIEFRDREYGDQWARILIADDLGLTVRTEKDEQVWFYPWFSVLAVRLEEPPARSSA